MTPVFKLRAIMFRYSYGTQMEHISDDIFAALADPTRREILEVLNGRQLPAGAIAQRFPQRRPAISKHLTILKRAGILAETRQAQRRLYAIRPEALMPAIRLLTGLTPGPSATPPESVPTPTAVTASVPTPAPAPTFELEFD